MRSKVYSISTYLRRPYNPYILTWVLRSYRFQAYQRWHFHLEHSLMSEQHFTSVKFTIQGRVQGVFFRKYTQSTAQSLQLTGWVRNTSSGNVTGEFEYSSYDKEKAEDFKNWLRCVGSPRSRIDHCEFDEVRRGEEDRQFEGFTILRGRGG